MASITQYMGSRYVPIFADPAEWNSTRTYEPLTIVLNEGNSYTSRQFVPVGVELTNTDYWLETGNYNAQVEQYRQEVISYLDNFYYNTPEMYGAKGDGVTDDTEAFQKALTAGGYVYLPGNYFISSTLTVKSNTAIIGCNNTITTNALTLFSLNGISNVYIANIKFYSTNTSTQTSGYNPYSFISVYNSSNVIIDNINAYNSVKSAISVENSPYTSIINCNIHECRYYAGIALVNTTKAIVSNTYSYNNMLDGIIISTVTNSIITHCYFNNNGEQETTPRATSNAYAVNCTNLKLENCIFDTSTAAGFESINGEYITVNNCIAKNNVMQGIALLGNDSNNHEWQIITNCTCINNGGNEYTAATGGIIIAHYSREYYLVNVTCTNNNCSNTNDFYISHAQNLYMYNNNYNKDNVHISTENTYNVNPEDEIIVTTPTFDNCTPVNYRVVTYKNIAIVDALVNVTNELAVGTTIMSNLPTPKRNANPYITFNANSTKLLYGGVNLAKQLYNGILIPANTQLAIHAVYVTADARNNVQS